ncbi:MAG: cytochrome C oxidase subunit IV family protein [Nitrospirae bacterium]|nr:cytochrome C oxidase subunit IV family protein [Nitrospirota bacterium]MBI5696853.1 cytochrome C oxidase subunit IV family protein [Nitrospirota bacterium]
MKDYQIYVSVWAALLVLTLVTWQVSYIDLGLANAAVALVIASFKASLVALFFMHLRQESRLVWGFAVFPLVILSLIIFGTLSDTLFR